MEANVQEVTVTDEDAALIKGRDADHARARPDVAKVLTYAETQRISPRPTRLLHRKHLQSAFPYSAGRRHRGRLATRSRFLTRGEIRARFHAWGYPKFELIGLAPIDLDGAITVVHPSARDECGTPAVPAAAEPLHDRRTR